MNNHPNSFRSRYGPWALVAGASEGLGREYVLQLAERGLNIAMVARRADPLEQTAEETRKRFGVEVRTLALDLSSADIVAQLQTALSDVEIGLLVYNAAIAVQRNFIESTPEELLLQLYVNCRGPLLLAREFGAVMAERGRGGILLMSSATGFVGSGLNATYSATKAFNTVLGEGLWQDLKSQGVDVMSFIAGATSTPSFVRNQKGDSSVHVMEPADVVRQALSEFGSRPMSVAGRYNRFTVFLLSRLLSRKRASQLITRATRAVHG